MPRALQYGVPYDLFWHINPKKLEPFRKAYDFKVEYDEHMAWLNGAYIRMAIGSALNGKKVEYPDDPMRKKYAKQDNGVQESAEVQALRFEQWAEVFNKKFDKIGV